MTALTSATHTVSAPAVAAVRRGSRRALARAGPLVRVTAGDVLDLTLTNRLPATTTLHSHGV
ncbi:multicopper oxidase domain-containing protein, partial [Streptomyces olivaceoviridis]